MSEKRKVAICGTAPSSYPHAPWDDESWEVWGTSRLYDAVPRWDRWYEIHHLDIIGKGWDCTEEERQAQRNKHLEWLATDHDGRPVYVQEEYVDRVANGRPYPLEKVKRMLHETYGDPEVYLTNSISYMLAHALLERPDRIGVWGVDLALSSEYYSQRPSVEYLLGLARGSGIEVTIPAEADLLKTARLYGYDDDLEMVKKFKAREEELQQRLEGAQNKREELKQEFNRRQGALAAAQGIMENGADPELKEDLEGEIERIQQEMQKIQAKAQQKQGQIHTFRGALDNMNYLKQSLI